MKLEDLKRFESWVKHLENGGKEYRHDQSNTGFWCKFEDVQKLNAEHKAREKELLSALRRIVSIRGMARVDIQDLWRACDIAAQALSDECSDCLGYGVIPDDEDGEYLCDKCQGTGKIK